MPILACHLTNSQCKGGHYSGICGRPHLPKALVSPSVEEEIQRLLKERSDKIAGLEEFSYEMTEEDFGKILQAMFDRGDQRWITPSGSITDVLRAYIKAGKIDNVSIACRMYSKVYGNSAGEFVARQLPAMLINHYTPITATLTFDQFLLWDRANPEWQVQIISHAGSPNLSTKVRDVVASMAAFKKNS